MKADDDGGREGESMKEEERVKIPPCERGNARLYFVGGWWRRREGQGREGGV